MKYKFIPVIFVFLILGACGGTQSNRPTQTLTPNSAGTITPTASLTFTPTPQPRLLPIEYGPDLEDFPPGINPLTGRDAAEPSLLNYPAVLVSISNMPVTARPQAGPGFAPWMFELFIGEGTTRFMGVFYGDVPRAVSNITGGCAVRSEIIRPAGDWIGNRVWLDENENGLQDAWEAGIGGVCVRLLNGNNHEVMDETTTDGNGYYAFDRSSALSILQFTKPAAYEFTQPDVGDDDRDSDANRSTGETRPFESDSTASFWDAGLILSEEPTATPRPVVTGTPPNWFIPPEPYVGPVRSGRLTYNQIGGMFPNSCLVYASAAEDIGEKLDKCEILFGVDRYTPNSALLTVKRLRELAMESLNPRQPVNYSGNVFSNSVPENGQPATTIGVYYHLYSQSGWQYDPISQAYLRYTDRADTTGRLFPATDRLTGRQTAFENVIVVFAEHERFRHNQLEIILSTGQKGHAYLFRDGQAIKIFWSTLNRDWEKKTGLLRPLYFLDLQNNPIALHPGRTWFHIVTPFSFVSDQGNGRWLVDFVQPEDPEDTPEP